MTVFIGLSFAANAADTIRVNIPRVTVTMARSYNFSSAANSVYVPVEFNSTMSADEVADYIEESNVFLFDHYGDDVATDEDGNLFTTYTDDEGKLIMERRGNTRYPSVCRRELYPYMQAHTGTVMTDWEGSRRV